MWYGLKEDGKLIAVFFFEHYPTVRDFKVRKKGGSTYVVVVVRIREVGQLP